MRDLARKDIDKLYYLTQKKMLNQKSNTKFSGDPYFVSASRKVWQHSRTCEDREGSIIQNWQSRVCEHDYKTTM